jgi:hypothetical protein
VDTLIVLRLAERIVAVVIGGVAIFLGYRLFLRTPLRNTSSGDFKLPLNTRVVLTRVGPGVFFALFGTAIVWASFYRQIDFREGPQNAAIVQGAGRRFIGAGDQITDTWRDSARAELRKHIAVLNTAELQINPGLSAFERSRLISGIDQAKLALMEPVWGDWGDKARFRQWLDEGKPAPPPELAKAVAEFEWPKAAR